MATFNDLKPKKAGKGLEYTFPNGFTISVINNEDVEHAYAGEDTYEVGILYEGRLAACPLTSDGILPWRTVDDINRIMLDIETWGRGPAKDEVYEVIERGEENYEIMSGLHYLETECLKCIVKISTIDERKGTADIVIDGKPCMSIKIEDKRIIAAILQQDGHVSLEFFEGRSNMYRDFTLYCMEYCKKNVMTDSNGMVLESIEKYIDSTADNAKVECVENTSVTLQFPEK